MINILFVLNCMALCFPKISSVTKKDSFFFFKFKYCHFYFICKKKKLTMSKQFPVADIMNDNQDDDNDDNDGDDSSGTMIYSTKNSNSSCCSSRSSIRSDGRYCCRFNGNVRKKKRYYCQQHLGFMVSLISYLTIFFPNVVIVVSSFTQPNQQRGFQRQRRQPEQQQYHQRQPLVQQYWYGKEKNVPTIMTTTLYATTSSTTTITTEEDEEEEADDNNNDKNKKNYDATILESSLSKTTTTNDKDNNTNNMENYKDHSRRRRNMLLSTAGTLLLLSSTSTNNNNDMAKAAAAPPPLRFGFNKKKDVYLVDTRDEISDSVRREQVDTPVPTLSSEYALLKILPVKNPVFRTLESNVEHVSILRNKNARLEGDAKNATWDKIQKSVTTAREILINKQSQLDPVFNPEDSTELSIVKGERGVMLIEQFRENLVVLSNAITAQNKTATLLAQKEALVTLGFLGELLVKEFPYRVPSLGKFSYLPRLLGRCQVTMRMKRKGVFLGNITIVADGYAAPITAGNFIDMCLRNFYTGLPIKVVNKKFAGMSSTIPVNVLGSFNEGFYDPLTAKLRCIPLEIIRFEKGSGKPQLTYASRGLPDTSLSSDMLGGDSTTVLSTKPLLTFDTPGLLALNHPDNNSNGGSAEFFGLTETTMPEGTSKSILDDQYAPFGFIITGYEIFCKLQPDDVIDAVFVDDFGRQNLIKIRQSSFKEAAQGSEAAKQDKNL